jgi:hypothetical protein
MKKNLLLIIFSFVNLLHVAEAQTFECFIKNDSLVSPTRFELDLYIISTSTPFNLRTVQTCVVFNPAFIPAGANIVASLVSGSTQLNNYNVSTVTWSPSGNGFQASSNTGVSCISGTAIDTVVPIRVGTFRLESNLPFNCAPSIPGLIGPSDPLPPGLILRMAVTRWNSLDCSDAMNTTISSNGTYSKFPSTAYGYVNNMSPRITSQPLDAANCAGSGFASFSVAASQAPGVNSPLTYTWLENGTPVTNGTTPNGTYSGAASTTLTITNPGAGLNGNLYTCVVSQCNVDTSVTVHFSVADPDDNNVCTIDHCDPVTGALTHTLISVDDGDACTVDGCDSVTGAFHTPAVTDDGNACTVDGCNTVTGVFNTPINIDDSDACTTDACDPLSGNVTHTPVDTDDNDLCTTDGCNTVTGIFHTPVNSNDNNVCTTDACDPFTGNISHTAVNISDNNACTVDGCHPVTGVYHTFISVNDNNICTTDACNPATGIVTHAPIDTDDHNPCTNDGCDAITGIFHLPRNTNDNNPCTTDACDPVTGIITHVVTNVNDNNSCTTDGCDPVTGVYHTPVNTNDNNPCTTDLCDPATGLITHPITNTDDANACTIDGCDPVSGVFHNPVAVDDGNDCTLDACNTTTGLITHTDLTPQAPSVSVSNHCGYSVLTATAVSGSLLWSNAMTTASITVNSPGTYSVTVTVTGCTSPAGSAVAAPLNEPVISLGNDTALSGSSLVLDAGPGFNSYVWSNAATSQSITVQSSGTYFVTVTASNGCTGSDTIEVSFLTSLHGVTGNPMEIFPNPAGSLLYLQTGGSAQIKGITIYNAAGQEQRVAYFSNKQGHLFELNTACLSPGVYTIEVLSSKDRWVTSFIRQ